MRYPGKLNVSTPTANPAVTTANAKAQLRVNHNADDTYIAALVAAATDVVEGYLNRAFVNRTYTLDLDGFPRDNEILLERAPLVSVTSIAYIDSAEANQTLSTDSYEVDTKSTPGRIVLATDATWPSTYDKPNTVTITFVAGMGADESSVDEKYQLMIKMLVANWYQNREPVVVGPGLQAIEVPQNLQWLMNPWVVH